MRWKNEDTWSQLSLLLLAILAVGVFAMAMFTDYPEARADDRKPGQVYASPDLSEGRARGVVRVKNIVCRVTLRGQECSESLGSGTVIGTTTDNTHLIVLSCAHVFEMRGKPQVEVGPRVWRDATIRAIDYRSDLSLLIVPSAEPIPGIAVAQEPPTTADPLVTRGYPDASMFIERPTRVIGSERHLWDVDCRPIGGESGGGLLSPAGVVGVVVLTEVEDPKNPERNPGGQVVGWPTVSKFVQATFPNVNRGDGRYQRQADPNDRGPNPLAPAPLPQAPAPPVAARPAAPPPANVDGPKAPPLDAKPVEAPPVEIDWSLAKVVVVVPRQKDLDRWDWLVRTAEKLTSEDTGLGQLARRLLSDTTKGKIDAEIVYQRIEPERYDKLVAAAGVRVGRFAGLIVAVRSQQESMFEPIRNMMIAFGERAVKSKLGDVPFELILERTSPEVFAATQDAIAFVEPAGSSPGNWLTALLGPLSGAMAEWLRQRKEAASLWTLS